MGFNLQSLTERAGWVPWDNCSYPAILDFPDPGFPPGLLSVAISSLILLYCYIALAQICDAYFIPAIKLISDGCKLTGDIAGAVLLASTSSIPELAVNLMTTFTVDDADVGAGTIVGGAVFNALAVPAICSMCVCRGARCEAWPVTRDALMSAASLVILTVVLVDGRIYWSEALFMLLVYASYVIGLNTDCKRWCCFGKTCYESDKDFYSKTPLLADACSQYLYDKEAELGSCEDAIRQTPLRTNPLMKFCQFLIMPVNWLLKYTIPCPVDGRWAVVCSFVSLVWIAGLIFIISWMITIIGYYLNVPDSLMGLTVLAIGLGMPDVLGSVSVARQGQSSMALCNALGANTFNVLVCLGLPWLIKAALFGTREGIARSVASSDFDFHYVKINSEGVEWSALIMLAALVLTYCSLAASKFTLSRTVGLICITLYVIYVTIVSLIEFNVFFLSNLPLCNIKDYYSD